VRHRPAAITSLVLRHLYGTVTGISTDNTTLTVTKEYPTVPPLATETASPSSQSLPILADSTNGTLFYDVDTPATPPSTIYSFSGLGSILAKGEQVRIAARYQQNGTLVAARVWASSSFNSVYLSPEGHVLHVNGSAATPNIVVQNELGAPVTVDVTASTLFYFRTPADAQTDAAAIQGTGGGVTFLTSDNLVRGFKVHVGVVDPLATPLVAATVDIENARYDGTLSVTPSVPATTGFTDTRTFATAGDGYTKNLVYINSGSGNGTDPTTGAAIDGFKWWNLGFPTVLFTGATGLADFGGALAGSVTFGGTAAVPTMLPWGLNLATWGDPALAAGWSVKSSILEPTQLPLGTVKTSWLNDSFTMSLPGGTSYPTVNVAVTPEAATLVYQVDRTSGVVTITPQDLTTSTGLTNAINGLSAGNAVKVYGIPQTGGIQAYVIFYYTNTQPTA
jgi:hypothetical protein